MIKEYQEEKNKLSYYLPWILLVDKGIVMNKNGTLQKTLKYRGNDLASATKEELFAKSKKINNVVKRLEAGWTLHIETRRKKSSGYPEYNFPTLAGKLMEKERQKFFKSGNQYENVNYITISYLTPSDSKQKLTDTIISNREKRAMENQIEYFKKEVNRVKGLFDEIFLETEELTDEETYTYLHSCISQKHEQEVKVPDVPLYIANYLSDTFMIGGLKPVLGKYHIRAITVKGFPQFTEPAFFNKLNDLNFEYRWVTRFMAISKLEAIKIIDRMWSVALQGRVSFFQKMKIATNQVGNGEIINENKNAVEMAQALEQQKALLHSDRVNEGYYTCTIFVWDKDLTIAEKKAEAVSKIIDDLGFISLIESTNTIQAFLGAVPGNIYNNVRKPILNSLSLSHLIPSSSQWAGDINTHLGQTLLYTETKGSTPFRFNLHVKDVGHTTVVGPTGNGKSVFLGTLAANFMKYPGAQVYFFDKDSSSRVLTYAQGGDFYDLGEDELSFQPFAELDDIKEQEWANGWLQDIFIQEGIILNHSIKEKIWEAIKLVAGLPVELRTLSSLKRNLNDKALSEAISPYLITGSAGKYFDNDKDNLNYNSWQSFEMGQVMQNKQVLVPLLNYLFHRIEKRLSEEAGKPTLIILDECWMFFDNPIFSEKIRDWLKTFRKKNASVVFATQELEDIMKSSLFSTILTACKTKIFLPNDKCRTEENIQVYKKFGFNEKELELIEAAIPQREYYYKSTLGNRMFGLALSQIELKLIASSQADKQQEAKELIKQCENADEFTMRWLKK